ncbi:hypothetical protein CBS147321_11255 [Aspergillus niger]|nr:hypothetical protein CBS12448_11098 [Aspergillus niger]KAI2867266.1 hypothetical protein CBS11852_11452 [Aspergillus niger]KAI2927153.1 hypothetical protein CBS147321_11255 [Aspergillus niger]KAI2936719.1 hypothetical protein CBS147322_11055 [Aspergillus niger]KAI3014425.1 hypothetical protein CBS147347_11482 [Aspergillus niger]
MLLVRPSSLPDLSFNPATLVKPESKNPLSYKVKIMVQLAHVQDLYLKALAERQNDRPYPSSLVESLQVELYAVRLKILEVRPKYNNTPMLESEWDAVDFTYFSIACTALRLDSILLHYHKKRQECVQCARNALRAMQQCHTYVSSTSNTTPDSLFWTVLLYPLTPFFVIFCNIVATSDVDDLKLLKEATVTVASIGENFSFSMNLHGLLSQLIKLCSQLEVPLKQTSTTKFGEDQSNGKVPELLNNPHAVMPEESEKDQNSRLTTTFGQAAEVDANTDPQMENLSSSQFSDQDGSRRNSIWDDGLLWDFFNIQPSVEWFDAGYDSLIDGPLD